MCDQSDMENTDKEANYRIYNFLKEKPELLVGVGSAFLAVSAALLAFCIYISEQAIVRYWNVDTVYINISTPEKIYSTAVSFVWMFLILLIFSVIMSVAEQSKQISYIKKYNRYLHWRCKWELLKLRTGKVLQKVCPSISAKIQYDYSSTKTDKIELLKQNIRSSNSRRCKQNMEQVILFEGLLTSVFIVWINTVLENRFTSLGEVFFAAVIISAIMIGLMYFVGYLSAPGFKKVRELANNDYKKGNINLDVPEGKFPFIRLLKGEYTLNFRMSDQRIKKSLWSVVALAVILLLIVTLFFSMVGRNNAEKQDEFWIVDCSGNNYAVVYNNGEIAVLARSKIEDGNIVIDTSQQKIMAVENLDNVTQWHGSVKLDPIEDE